MAIAKKNLQFLKSPVNKGQVIDLIQEIGGGGGGSSNDKGWFIDAAALTLAYPVGQNGWFAVVGSTDSIWVWDSGTNAWVNSGLSSLTTINQNFTNQTSVTVIHNLGYKPLVQVTDGSGSLIGVVVEHINTSSFVITSNSVISGTIIYY